MNTPILQPPPLERLAWLKPGDRIGHRTVKAIGPISGHRMIHVNGEPRRLDGAHLWIRTTDGIDWCEWPKHGQRSLTELAQDGPHWIQCDTPLFSDQTMRLANMQQRAGFEYYPGQRTYLLEVARSDGALLAAEVGTGKTALAIGLIEIHRPKRGLIIAPQGVISPTKRKQDDEWVYDASQWQREFTKFAPWMKPEFITGQPTGDGVFLTYMQDALLNTDTPKAPFFGGGRSPGEGDDAFVLRYNAWVNEPEGGWLKDVPPDFFDMIIVDEAHLLQSRDTLMGQALYRMQPRWRYALTATPMPNRATDCFAMLRWLRPDVPIEIAPTRETKIVNGKSQRIADPVEPFSPLLLGATLRHAIAPIRKRDIRPDMPPLHVHRVYVDAEPELSKRYDDDAKNFTLPSGDCGTIERARLTKLRNLCSESVAKAKLIASTIRASGKASIVVSARTSQTTAISELIGRELTIGRIDSTIDSKLHGQASAAFQRGDTDALLMGIKCAHGHSFPGCDTIHVASLEWSYGSFDQALGRVYRINSHKPVHAYVYLLRGTIEERMFDNVCRQQSIAHRIIFGLEPVTS